MRMAGCHVESAIGRAEQTERVAKSNLLVASASSLLGRKRTVHDGDQGERVGQFTERCQEGRPRVCGGGCPRLSQSVRLPGVAPGPRPCGCHACFAAGRHGRQSG